MSIHKRFAEKFAQSTEFATEAELNACESSLSQKFPLSYRSYVKNFGATHNPSLLDLVISANSDLPDLFSFIEVSEIVKANELYWSGGMPNSIYTFASDCSGNAFCFKVATRKDLIYLYDLEFDELDSLDLTFDELLNEYLRVADA